MISSLKKNSDQKTLNSDIIIHLDNVTKQYRLYRNKNHRLYNFLSFGMLNLHKNFNALTGLSFTIKKGEATGIIGLNGSGKSTLLKLLCGIISPTKGTVLVQGSVASLLELGVGFSPELTGRENIYLQGALMGLSKEKIKNKIPLIEEFADIKEFIHQPVKRYSSGMFVRLAFSCAVNVDPDILIIDEALAVGDLDFQIKCLSKINDFIEQNKTIILVSHDMHQIRSICKKAMWIDKGCIRLFDNKIKVTDQYNSYIRSKSSSQIKTKKVLKQDKKRNTKKIEILNTCLCDMQNKEKNVFDFGEKFQIIISCKVNTPVDNPVIGIGIYNSNDIYIWGNNTRVEKIKWDYKIGHNEIKIKLNSMRLLGGDYYLKVHIHDKTALQHYDFHPMSTPFKINSYKKGVDGIIAINHEWIL